MDFLTASPLAEKSFTAGLYRLHGRGEAHRAHACAVYLAVDSVVLQEIIAVELVEGEGEDVLEHLLRVVSQQFGEGGLVEHLACAVGYRDRPAATSLEPAHGIPVYCLVIVQAGGSDGHAAAVLPPCQRGIVSSAAAQGKPEQRAADELEVRALACLVRAIEDGDRVIEVADRAVGELPEPIDMEFEYSHWASSSMSRLTAVASAAAMSAAISSSEGSWSDR